jgi:hypothetical protein
MISTQGKAGCYDEDCGELSIQVFFTDLIRNLQNKRVLPASSRDDDISSAWQQGNPCIADDFLSAS